MRLEEKKSPNSFRHININSKNSTGKKATIDNIIIFIDASMIPFFFLHVIYKLYVWVAQTILASWKHMTVFVVLGERRQNNKNQMR